MELVWSLPLCLSGLAVGVGFAAIGKTTRATFESARRVEKWKHRESIKCVNISHVFATEVVR